ncbi:ATP-dependent RNA helicase DED1 [Planoprotostelium fungivorum]|uniref:RNA helicase n=1 Tax=Planoprotostelium fungivorum TaxID=1890364 RepID=A0A2P6MX53_9EUKA|nr:ATP-dependent RNA helicase DED1 [Planoprotostelium fungivorum]PRP76302.1 ATP-dependent RNA helicase DED1 [Planoprotostelium fungivorum]
MSVLNLLSKRALLTARQLTTSPSIRLGSHFRVTSGLSLASKQSGTKILQRTAFGRREDRNSSSSADVLFKELFDDITDLDQLSADKKDMTKYSGAKVEITGGPHPDPIEGFADLEFGNFSSSSVILTPIEPRVLRNLTTMGYKEPIPVQKYSLPIINSGADLMSCAQTGSGKTAAFLLPIINKCIQLKSGKGMEKTEVERSAAPVEQMNRPSGGFQRVAGGFERVTGNGFGGPEGMSGGRREGFGGFRSEGGFGRSRSNPIALILAPTRELAQQIENECRKFTFGTRVQSACLFGGAPAGPQISRLSGADIVIATPGRFEDLKERGCLSVSNIKFLVLDEADRMLDVGFGPAINSIVKDPNFPSNNDRQTLLFSATFPKEIQHLAKSLLKPSHLFLVVGRIGSASELVQQQIIRTPSLVDKEETLIELLEKNQVGKTLIFCKTKHKVDEVGEALHRMGHKVATVHGDFSQGQRNAAMKSFISNQVSVLVATDVAARGLDVKDIETVINFDLPMEIDDYVHRIGRTGRAGRTGTSISFFNPKDDSRLSSSLITILSDAKQEVPSFLEESVSRRPSFGGGNKRSFGRREYGGSQSYGQGSGSFRNSRF